MKALAWKRSCEIFFDKLQRCHDVSNVRAEFAACLPESEIKALDERLPLRMPPGLRTFLRDMARAVGLSYSWQPRDRRGLELLFPNHSTLLGGADLCEASRYEEMQADCAGWAAEWHQPDRELWLRSFPFLAVGNGDFLAVDTSEVVVYLAHDGNDESRPLFPTFETFLEAWEQMAYVRPALWILSDICRAEGEYLAPHPVKCARLRTLLLTEKGDSDGPAILKFPGQP